MISSRGELVAAWFTFEAGAARWLTAQSSYAGNHTELTVFETTGGELDAPVPVTTVEVGLAPLEFSSSGFDGLLDPQGRDVGGWDCAAFECDPDSGFDDNGIVARAPGSSVRSATTIPTAAKPAASAEAPPTRRPRRWSTGSARRRQRRPSDERPRTR